MHPSIGMKGSFPKSLQRGPSRETESNDGKQEYGAL